MKILPERSKMNVKDKREPGILERTRLILYRQRSQKNKKTKKTGTLSVSMVVEISLLRENIFVKSE